MIANIRVHMCERERERKRERERERERERNLRVRNRWVAIIANTRVHIKRMRKALSSGKTKSWVKKKPTKKKPAGAK